MRLPDILFGMSISIEKNPNFNPYAAPLESCAESGPHVQSQLRASDRASLRKIRRVNLAAIVADLSYVATCCSFGVGLCFLRGEAAQLSFIAFCIALFLLWYSVVAGLFRARGISFGSIATPFLLPFPIIGTVAFLFAKEDIRKFMIANGYRPRFLGFAVDDDQRQAMDQNPNYTPSQSTHHDGSKRRYIFSLGECWIILGILCYVSSVLFTFISFKLQY